MASAIEVPTLGESVSEATVARWMKAVGEAVTADEPLVELETDKVTVEVPAPASGRLESIAVDEGETVAVGTVLGQVGSGAGSETAVAPEGDGTTAEPAVPSAGPADSAPAPEPAAQATPAPAPEKAPAGGARIGSPAAEKLIREKGLHPADIHGSGRDGRITKEDVLAHLGAAARSSAAPPAAAARERVSDPRERRVRMSRLRQRIAQRLKEAQTNAAMLTTFNEVDMTNAMAMRRTYRDSFEKTFGLRLGIMGLFVKATVDALHRFPGINGEIDGTDIIYKDFYNIGVAVGTDQGLVVPVVRDADQLSLAGIEKAIGDMARRARDGKLGMEEMTGGTFTISNGGVYGSLLSTPILNPPQSGILGLHKIEKRARVMPDGSLQAREMMYVALSYDHRIVDGREAVSFLVRVKECVENPERLMLEV